MNTIPTTTEARENTTNHEPAQCQACGRVIPPYNGERVTLRKRGEMPAYICGECASGENDHAADAPNIRQVGTMTSAGIYYSVCLVFKNATPEARAELASSGYQLSSLNGYHIAKSPVTLSLKPFAKKLRTIEQLAQFEALTFDGTQCPVYVASAELTADVMEHVNKHRREVLTPAAEWIASHREEARALFGRDVDSRAPLFRFEGEAVAFECAAFDSAAQYKAVLNLAKGMAKVLEQAPYHKAETVGKQIARKLEAAAAKATQGSKEKQLKA